MQIFQKRMSTLLGFPFDTSRPRSSTLGSDFRRGSDHRRGSLDTLKLAKTKSLPKNNNGAKSESKSIMTIFQDWRKGSDRDSHEDALARLSEELDRIRGDLSSLRMEGRSIEQRVANVTADVEDFVALEQPAQQDRRQSLEVIEESDDESLEYVEETTKLRSKCGFSCASLPVSNRDSGYITDPAFEMTDPRKYCILNNSPSHSTMQKKTRSTSAIDFIRNDLHDDRRTHLKATSYDRLSCLSDSALATYAVRHRVL